MIAERRLAEVRELHHPLADGVRRDGSPRPPTCAGCDGSGMDAEPPYWPCRTAAIVYTPHEIAAVPGVEPVILYADPSVVAR